MELEEQALGSGVTVSRRLRELADTRCGVTFMVDARSSDALTEVTFGETADRAARCAAVLQAVGVGAGDAVHVQLPNSPDYLIALFALAQLGAVMVPTSPSSTPDDIAYIASHAACKVSIVGVDDYESLATAGEMNPELTHVLTVGGQAGDSIDHDAALVSASPVTRDRSDEDAVTAVLYTSGTTGWPKGVTITHRNLMFAGDAVGSYVRLRPDDRWLVSLPLSHMNALGYSAMSALSSGASITIVDRFDAVEWCRAAERSRATVASLFAVHVRKLLDTLDEPIATSIRTLLFAQHLTRAERDLLGTLIGAEALQVYGMTETIAPTIADPPYGPPRVNAIGRLTLWSDARVVDRSGSDVPDGTPGELLVGGQPGRTLMAGYWQRPDETALIMRDGWLRTGDRVVREADGYFRFLGRSVEVIKPGVDNVSAPEIERVLLEHVSVRDAAVVGARDRSGDEVIVAFVVLHPDDDVRPREIIDWTGERLADYKVPHQVLFVEQLPRTAVGKVHKRELAMLAAKSMGAASS
jgi:crotonobetaine/carnitine-CoA ligase